VEAVDDVVAGACRRVVEVILHDNVFLSLNFSFSTWAASGKNLCLYSPMGAWPVVMCVKQAHRELVNPMLGSHKLPLAYVGLITLWSSSSNIRK